jgi:ribosomal protein S3
LFFSSLKTLFKQQVIPLSGLRFKISGRIGGKLRKSVFGYKLGQIQLMSFDSFIDFSCDFVYTQYGSFSLKL